MAKHVAILGFIYGIFGALATLGALLVMLFGWGSGLAIWMTGEHGAAAAGGIAALIGGGIGLILLVGGLLNLFTAVGLLGRRTWGRVLGVIASILNIFPLSFMTLFGVYGLWVLLSEAGGREFSRAR